jgi:hypothetical protein
MLDCGWTSGQGPQGPVQVVTVALILNMAFGINPPSSLRLARLSALSFLLATGGGAIINCQPLQAFQIAYMANGQSNSWGGVFDVNDLDLSIANASNINFFRSRLRG